MSLKFFVTIILLCLSSILLLVSLYFALRSPKHTNTNIVRAHKGWGSCVLLLGSFLAFGGVWSMYYGTNGHSPNSIMEGIWVSLIGFAFTGLMLPSFTQWHEVIWDEEGLEGPNKQFGPTLRFSRTKLDWDEIVEFGQTFTLYNFVKSVSGEKIYFSPYSTDLEDLEQKIWESLANGS